MCYDSLMRWLCITVLLLTLPGCIFYSRWRESAENASYLEQRARLLTMYNDCLARWQAEPRKAKEECEVFTQSLYALDVRGLR